MNELVAKEQKDTITSLELLDQINLFRKQEGNRTELRHDTLRNIIKDEFEEEILSQNILEKPVSSNGGRPIKTFELTTAQAKQVLVRESKFVRKAVIHYIEELENKLKPKLPTTYLEALKELVAKEEALLLANQTIKEQQPKVEYHDTVLYSDKLVTITSIAKDLGMSAIKLNKILNELHIQYKKGRCWYLYAEYENLVPAYFDYHITEYGQMLKATELGRKWIINRLEEEGVM